MYTRIRFHVSFSLCFFLLRFDPDRTSAALMNGCVNMWAIAFSGALRLSAPGRLALSPFLSSARAGIIPKLGLGELKFKFRLTGLRLGIQRGRDSGMLQSVSWTVIRTPVARHAITKLSKQK
jgi:hypothetical protein